MSILTLMGGRKLTNILGNDGGCESLSPFTLSASGSGSVTLSNTQTRNGNNSIKCTAVSGNSFFYKDYAETPDKTKQYFLAGWAYLESSDLASSVTLSLRDYGALTSRYNVSLTSGDLGAWKFIYVKVPTSNTLTGTGFRLLVGLTGVSNSVIYFDGVRLYEVSAAEYTAIGSTITPSSTPSIDQVYPYVNGVGRV